MQSSNSKSCWQGVPAACEPYPVLHRFAKWPLLAELDGHQCLIHFPPHLARALVRAQTRGMRVPQPTLGRPLHEPYLRDQLRPHPLHLPHLFGRHAAAPAGFRVRQIDKGALIDMVRLQRLEDLATQVRNEAGPHLACEPQAGLIVSSS